MSLSDLFRFISPEEKSIRQRDFQNKVLPLGLEQKGLALNAMRPLINPKLSDEELLYTFFIAKQKYIDTSNIDVVHNSLKKHDILSETEQSYIVALILLDTHATSLEQYPNSNDVKSRAKLKQYSKGDLQ